MDSSILCSFQPILRIFIFLLKFVEGICHYILFIFKCQGRQSYCGKLSAKFTNLLQSKFLWLGVYKSWMLFYFAAIQYGNLRLCLQVLDLLLTSQNFFCIICLHVRIFVFLILFLKICIEYHFPLVCLLHTVNVVLTKCKSDMIIANSYTDSCSEIC